MLGTTKGEIDRNAVSFCNVADHPRYVSGQQATKYHGSPWPIPDLMSASAEPQHRFILPTSIDRSLTKRPNLQPIPVAWWQLAHEDSLPWTPSVPVECRDRRHCNLLPNTFDGCISFSYNYSHDKCVLSKERILRLNTPSVRIIHCQGVLPPQGDAWSVWLSDSNISVSSSMVLGYPILVVVSFECSTNSAVVNVSCVPTAIRVGEVRPPGTTRVWCGLCVG